MTKLEYRPIVSKTDEGWRAVAHMYEDGNSIFTACEVFNEWTTKQEAWDDAVAGVKRVVKHHNSTCNCSKKAVVGTY